MEIYAYRPRLTALKKENLTIEDIQAIIGGETKAEASNLLTVEEYEKRESQRKPPVFTTYNPVIVCGL